MAGVLSVTKRFRFEAAHQLPKYKGACSRLHGHSYVLEVTVGLRSKVDAIGEALDTQGMVMDFADLKSVVNRAIINRIDHTFLNESLPIADTTAEAMLYYFAERLRRNIDNVVVYLKRLKLYETEDNYAEWNCNGVEQ